jgi:ABC-type dipeptide/oligopeptide/nickel transport system ATPase component
VTGLDLELHRGKVLGLVGEPGCSKSVTSLDHGATTARPDGADYGSIRLGDQELSGCPERELRRIRGKRIAMIVQ